MTTLIDTPFVGPDGSTSFVDSTGRTWEQYGNARIVSNALLLSAYGDIARTPGTDLGRIYSGEPGVKGFVQVDIKTTVASSTEQIVLDYYISGTGLRWQVSVYNGKMQVYNSSNGRYIFGTSFINDGQWHTLRMERENSVTRIYVDGTLESSYASTTVSGSSAPYLTLGNEGSSGTQFIGSMRNLTAGYDTPPPAPAITHSPWIRRQPVGWNNVRKVQTVRVSTVYLAPPVTVRKVQTVKSTRGVPPWWGAPGSTSVLPTYKLRGRVMQRDPDTLEDTPLQNVRVALFFRRLHTLIDIQLSDANGYVQFDNLMPGVQAYYGIAFDSDGGLMQNSVIWDRLTPEPGP